MQTRTTTTGFWQRQPLDRRQPPGQKNQNLGQNKGKSTKVVKAKKKSPVVVPVVKPISTGKGKIPPFNPNAMKGKTPPFNPNPGSKKLRTRKQVVSKKSNRSRKTQLKPFAKTMLYAMRLLIVGVGIGAIVGTVLSVFDPASRITRPESQSNTTVEQAQPQNTPSNNSNGSGLSLSQENGDLKAAFQKLAANEPNLTPGILWVDLENGSYVDVNASSSFPAASTIKLPILVALFQDVDAGKINLDETMTLQKQMIAGGSGDLQYKRVGTKFTILELATKMITVSDNTAANMLMSRLGGIEELNQRIQSWGLTATAIHNQLPDLQGTNTTSPKDLASLIGMVTKGNLVSQSSRDRTLDIMRRTVRNNLLPAGLGSGVTVAHKTGDIGTMLADTGLVELPNGKRYIISVMVQRPNNDNRAERLISSISRAAYQQINPNGTTANGTGNTPPANNYQPPAANPSVRNTVPPTTYQPPALNPSVRNTVPTMPTTTYRAPVITAPPYYGTGSTLPSTGYQPPVMTPPQYYPMPGYQPPITTQQYYYPYQR
ncbi:serine hydrolase [Aetokthonos hydrillicola Thurmond2011]|jgi:beta-lactamase class A|uniref:Serine hydrolase n=1 Tax=Aetokthonos hydrillicola Thurmond2011 TaxID=2712845 RepID=A0AAP5ID72_9CYAN|nr:serine hydrolase [Aetokthonos hydrillicola]MBO3461941.1 serine hydrolase [Aetokthonos hydrillicola CCALA 1050]MBW4585394.1 serine hydrolase [Aetokthonos hydrillicola CCALA 1050]MDR9899099.1 serine hydrolase [Aetokthonos hydrillicola Thurmond2011]